MLIKKKSLIVALISSLVISLVLVLTLIGYLAYIELKAREFENSYQEDLQKISARLYSKYIEVSKLTARAENVGALKGQPIIEGLLKNSGSKNITDLLMSVKFLDPEGAIIYEVIFHPNEPSLGRLSLTQVAVPYLSATSRFTVKSGGELPFKRILTNCPNEILAALQEGRGYAKCSDRWSGKLTYEILSVEFSSSGKT